VEEPLPQEQISTSETISAPRDSVFELRFFHGVGIGTMAIHIAAHMPPGRSSPCEFTDAVVRDVVFTDTLTVDATVPLTATVPGTEQVAPFGAPVQVRVALPLVPLPELTGCSLRFVPL
jgi:hypothetical protein